MLPRKSEMRYNWVHVRLDAIDLEELRELVIDAWRMCVPKSVSANDLLVDVCSAGRFLRQLNPGGEPELGVDVREVGLNCPR